MAHEDLWCASIMSRYGRLYDGRDWFAFELPGDQVHVSAALLEFPGSQLHLAFQFSPPVPVTFRGAEMEFRIGALQRENWAVGFCTIDDFDGWRGRETE